MKTLYYNNPLFLKHPLCEKHSKESTEQYLFFLEKIEYVEENGKLIITLGSPYDEKNKQRFELIAKEDGAILVEFLSGKKSLQELENELIKRIKKEDIEKARVDYSYNGSITNKSSGFYYNFIKEELQKFSIGKLFFSYAGAPHLIQTSDDDQNKITTAINELSKIINPIIKNEQRTLINESWENQVKKLHQLAISDKNNRYQHVKNIITLILKNTNNPINYAEQYIKKYKEEISREECIPSIKMDYYARHELDDARSCVNSSLKILIKAEYIKKLLKEYIKKQEHYPKGFEFELVLLQVASLIKPSLVSSYSNSKTCKLIAAEWLLEYIAFGLQHTVEPYLQSSESQYHQPCFKIPSDKNKFLFQGELGKIYKLFKNFFYCQLVKNMENNKLSEGIIGFSQYDPISENHREDLQNIEKFKLPDSIKGKTPPKMVIKKQFINGIFGLFDKNKKIPKNCITEIMSYIDSDVLLTQKVYRALEEKHGQKESNKMSKAKM